MQAQVSLTPIKDAGGFITNYVGVLQDVTERKSSEAAFKLRDHALSTLSEVGSIMIQYQQKSGTGDILCTVQAADGQAHGADGRAAFTLCLTG